MACGSCCGNCAAGQHEKCASHPAPPRTPQLGLSGFSELGQGGLPQPVNPSVIYIVVGAAVALIGVSALFWTLRSRKS